MGEYDFPPLVSLFLTSIVSIRISPPTSHISIIARGDSGLIEMMTSPIDDSISDLEDT
jgi:hypothetical protein